MTHKVIQSLFFAAVGFCVCTFAYYPAVRFLQRKHLERVALQHLENLKFQPREVLEWEMRGAEWEFSFRRGDLPPDLALKVWVPLAKNGRVRAYSPGAK